jgi:putative ABC transport system permease protein
MAGWGRQTVAVALLNLRSLPQRLGPSAAAVAGIAGVVVVLVSVLAIAEGFRATLEAAGDPQTAVVTSAGAEEMASDLSPQAVPIVEAAPGVARGERGALASAELYVIVNHPKKSTGTTVNVPLRGMGRSGLDVRPRARIVAGRMFQPGRHELVVGRGAERQFEGLEPGRTVEWDGDTWSVVGTFEAGGTVWESELWCDVTVLQSAYRRIGFSSVRLRLDDPGGFAVLKRALADDRRLDVDVVRESEHLAEQSTATARLITTVGFAVATLMAAGAVFGALNTMHTAVSARTREIATLRALGFAGGPVVVSVLLESLVLALAGGLLGGGAAWAVLHGHQTATLNWQTYTQVAFALSVTPRLLVEGVAYAAAMGLAGGLLPALRAARLPVAVALRGV